VIGVHEDDFAVRINAVVDLEVCKLGNEFGDGVGREPLALFVKDHHRDSGDRLGH
jgi:hypothetical protein